MRRLLVIMMALAAIAASHHAWAGSSSRTHDDSTTPIDESDDYQSCTQGDAPLFSALKPTSDQAWNTYMHYTVTQDGRYNDILMWGTIDACDEPRLRKVLHAAKPVGTISLYSGGGDLEEAFAMGRTLRDFGATTLIPGFAQCISACDFIFMGGVVRMMDPGAVFGVHMFANDDADKLQAELVNPPSDLLSFVQLFPFRSDVSMQDVDDAVKQRNDTDNEAVGILEQVYLAENAQLAAQSKPPAANQVVSNSTAAPQPISPDDVNAVNTYCRTIMKVGLGQDAPLAEQDDYHKVCIRILSRPYTEADWFQDEATKEDVKQIQQHTAQVAASIARYLSEMSISLRFLTDFANIPNSHWQSLSIDDLRDLNVVNAD
jgi:hypothetical protein